MAIRRKQRIGAKSPGTRGFPLKSETVQKNIERMRNFTSAAAAQVAAAAMAPGRGRDAAYRSPSEATSAVAGASATSEAIQPAATTAPSPEQVLSKASEGILAAMRQAETSIRGAEAILLNSEASAEERINEAQRIAEDAVVRAMSQCETTLHAATSAPQPHSPAPASSSDTPAGGSSARSEVQ
jgi:hypothetical protein